MLHRTLLIGLGGTGIDLLRKFKTHYGKYYDKEQKYIQILGIDTTNQRTDSSDPFLENHEFLHLGNPVITSANVMQFRKRNQFRWLPDDLPAFSVATGAGMRRFVGHVAYFWRGQDIAAHIERAMHTLNHAEVSGEFANVVDGAQTRVFIISSVCGGTGTGMFLDIAFPGEPPVHAAQLRDSSLRHVVSAIDLSPAGAERAIRDPGSEWLCGTCRN